MAIQYPETMIPVDDMTRTEADGLAEIFVNPPDIADDDPFAENVRLPWKTDIEGHGVILYVFKGKRTWVGGSVSKVPFSYLRKALDTTVDFEYLENVFLVRGTDGYPLSEREAKAILSMLNTRFKDTRVSSRVSYTSAVQLNEEEERVVENIFLDLVEALEATGLNLTKLTPEHVVAEGQTLLSGSGEVTVNGVKLAVQTRLKDENDPTQGLQYFSVRGTIEDTGENVLFTSTGEVSTSAVGTDSE
jgi:hypothetical protein